MKTKIHIVPHDGEWAIRLANSEHPASVHPTQQAAIESAMDIAEDEESDIVVHRRNGSFRNVINYETIEARANANGGRHIDPVHLAWGIFAAGALTAIAVYLATHPPRQARRWVHQLDEQRPDWLRFNS
ncbi:MAG: DUF2188 domain-containing protein [Akkermansiaceae bacterium]|nr:DUF2188 domain-containing protein [Akkermansiaceae bacterium]NNM30179.1 DUF2188 domain-containing protein [Akkermansiaceae bacterium]